MLYVQKKNGTKLGGILAHKKNRMSLVTEPVLFQLYQYASLYKSTSGNVYTFHTCARSVLVLTVRFEVVTSVVLFHHGRAAFRDAALVRVEHSCA